MTTMPVAMFAHATPWFVADGPAALLVAALLAPLALACAMVSSRLRPLVPSMLWLAPLPALGLALAAGLGHDGPIRLVADASRLELTLLLDGPRTVLLGVTALLWSVAGLHAQRTIVADSCRVRFAIAWLLTLAGCVGVFMAGDLVLFYLLFGLASLAATGLVAHDGTPKARRAAGLYFTFAVAGEAFLLIAFLLLAYQSPGESLRIDTVVAALPDGPFRTQIVVFLILGFGVKVGLIPLHGWLPIAHPAAPAPASAVLSGALIKTGVIGFVAFLLPLGVSTGLPINVGGDFGFTAVGWGNALIVIGFATALYGGVLGLTQANPKTVLAYSSVSQMGIVTALVGGGMAMGDVALAAIVAAFHSAHHALVKGALFLGVAATASVTSRTPASRVTVAAMALLALSLAGLPLSSGALAKGLGKPIFGDGVVATVAIVSTIVSTILMVHFLLRLVAPKESTPVAPEHAARAPLLPFALVATAAFVVPWAMVGAVLPGGGLATLAPAALWAATWPIGVGIGLLVVSRRIRGAFARPLPTVPEGDIAAVAKHLAIAMVATGGAVDRLERRLRRWSTAGATLLLTALLLALLLHFGGAP